MVSSIRPEVIIGAASSTSEIFNVRSLGSLVFPAASVAITSKLYSGLVSKSGFGKRVTAPVDASTLSAGSLSSDKLKVTPSLKSAESSATAV